MRIESYPKIGRSVSAAALAFLALGAASCEERQSSEVTQASASPQPVQERTHQVIEVPLQVDRALYDEVIAASPNSAKVGVMTLRICDAYTDTLTSLDNGAAPDAAFNALGYALRTVTETRAQLIEDDAFPHGVDLRTEAEGVCPDAINTFRSIG